MFSLPDSKTLSTDPRNDDKCAWAKPILFNTTKHVCVHHVIVNRIKIRLKITTSKLLLRPYSSLNLDAGSIKVDPICDVASTVLEAMFTELTVNVVSNVVKLFV